MIFESIVIYFNKRKSGNWWSREYVSFIVKAAIVIRVIENSIKEGEELLNIGIVSPFNPYAVKNYISYGGEVIKVNENATAVNILVTSLLKLGHKVHIYTTTNTKDTMNYKGELLEVHVLSKVFCPKGLSNIRIVERLKKVIAREVHMLDVLHAQWTYEYAMAAKGFENILPVICTVRDWCPYQLSLAVGFYQKYNWRLNYLLFKSIMKSKKILFVANSMYTYNQIKKVYTENDVRLIPNPIQKKFILVDQKSKEKSKTIFISICQGVEEKRKNIERLLEAFHKYRKRQINSELIIIGKYSSEWKDKYNKLNILEGVNLTGQVDHNEVFAYLDQADVLIHPSLEETFGNILLEAMARKVICIGGENAGAVPEVLGKGKYGILCNMEDVNNIVNAMILTEDNLYVNKVIQAASEYIINSYSDDIIAKKHIKLYEDEILNSSKR